MKYFQAPLWELFLVIDYIIGEINMSKNINTYAEITVEALKELKKHHGSITAQNVKDVWINTAVKLGKSDSITKKGCPKGAFLGILLSGKVKNINVDKYSLNTRDIKNKNAVYGKEIIKLLQNKTFTVNDKSKIWNYICENIIGKSIKHNGQVDVAFAFYENGYIIK